MSYIPRGCDQQGRYQAAESPPRRADGAPEAAHAASEHTGEDYLTLNELRERAANRLAALVAVAAVLVVITIVALGWWQ